MQTPGAEQAHDSRHLCMGTSRVRSVPLTFTTRMYQPRAGHVTDVAALAKLMSRKVVTPPKRFFLLMLLIKLKA